METQYGSYFVAYQSLDIYVRVSRLGILVDGAGIRDQEIPGVTLPHVAQTVGTLDITPEMSPPSPHSTRAFGSAAGDARRVGSTASAAFCRRACGPPDSPAIRRSRC